MQFKHHLTISFVVLLADMMNGVDWKTRMAARLAHSLCDQLDKFLQDGTMPPPEMKPVPNRSKINGEVKIKECADSSCQPSKIFRYEAFRHERVEVTGNSYPSVVGIVEIITEKPEYIMNGFFVGHAFFIDPSTLLTTATVGKNINTTSASYLYKLVLGERSRKRYQDDVKIAQVSLHPKYNGTTLENNFAKLHLDKPVTFNDKIKNISLSATGGNCNGKNKFASWTKMVIGGEGSHFRNYHEQLHEIKSLTLAMPSDLEKSPCPESAVCTSALLCGLWDQGSPLICSEGSKEYAYALASHYFIDYATGGEICEGFSTFATLDGALDWIGQNSKKG